MSDELFDLERAERLLPELNRLLHAALEQKKQLTEHGQEQARIIEGIIVRGGSRVNPDRFRRSKQAKENAGERLRETVEEIEGLGCLVKDLDIGLVDFPSRVGERDLYLCWKLGEPRIRFWHYVEEGFAGRKPLDEAMIRQIQRSGGH
jgi:hypothetical protein